MGGVISQRYLTPASSALLKTSFSENLFHKKSFSCRQQQHSHLGNVNFSIVFILLPLRIKSGTQHSWPVFRDFFGSMPPNRLPLLEIRSLWNVPADPTPWKFSSSDLESWRCPSLERLQQQGKQTSSPTPLFLPHPSLTLTNNHLGASLRSSRRGGQLLQMFAGIPLRFWSLCLPVTCASKRERLRECCPLWLSEPSRIVSEHHSGCSAAPVPKRAKQQVPDRDVHQLASLTCRQAGSRHSWSISVIDTAYFFWHISEEDIL